MKITFIIYITFGVLAIFSCGSPHSSKLTEEAPKHTFDANEWESLLAVVYDDPTYFLNHTEEIITKVTSYSSYKEVQEEYVWAIINMAYTLLTTDGKARLAASLYERGLVYNQEYNILKPEDVATYIYKPLGNCYTMLADYEKAQKFITNAIENTKDKSTISSLRNNLGISFLYNEKYHEAISNILQNLSPANVPIDTLDRALSFNILSDAYYKNANIDSAIYYNKKAIAIFKKHSLLGDTLIWYSSSLEMEANLYKEQNKLQEARKSALNALNLIEHAFPNSRSREKAKVSNLIASLYPASSNSLHYYRKSIELLANKSPDADYILDYTYTTALLGLAGNYKHSNIDSTIHYYIKAIENDFRTQQFITSKSSHQYNNQWNKKIVDEAVSILFKHYQKGNKKDKEMLASQALWLIELSKGRQLINEINRSNAWDKDEGNRLEITFENIQNLYRKKHESNDHQKENINKEIDRALLEANLKEGYLNHIFKFPEKEHFLASLKQQGYSYISIFEHQDSSYSIVTYSKDKCDLHKIHDINFHKTINTFKTKYFTKSPKAYNNDPEGYRQKAEFILNKIAPLLPVNHTKTFISPDGATNGLPFDALVHKNRFLAETLDIGYINSFIIFDILEPYEKSSDLAILYKEKYTSPFPNLPFVRQEVLALSKRYKSQKYGPSLQTIYKINELFKSESIIHIAAHTSIDSNNPPTLQLEEKISTDALQFYSINSPLIFLASCNTSSGEILSSEGIASLNRSFLSKGVPSVISTYWYANDNIMQSLTEGFYKRLSSTSDPLSALAENKRHHIKNANAMMKNPWYWANLNYHGIDNVVGIKKKSFFNFF